MQRIGLEFLPLEDAAKKSDLLALEESLTQFEKKRPDKAQLVKLRFFVAE